LDARELGDGLGGQTRNTDNPMPPLHVKFYQAFFLKNRTGSVHLSQ